MYCLLFNMKSKTINKYYPFQVWITSILVTPLLFAFYLIIQEDASISDVWILIPLFISFSSLPSLPILLVTYLVFRFIESDTMNTWKMKLILATIASSGAFFIISLLFTGDQNGNPFDLSILYTLGILLSSFLFGIKKKKPPL